MYLMLIVFLWFPGTTGEVVGQTEKLFQTIDQHTRLAPESLTTDLDQLTAYLVAPARNETEAARALYTWIIEHIDYDREAVKNNARGIVGTPEESLKRRKAICLGYALLFKEMAAKAGLEVEIISGYGKTDLNCRPDLHEPDHAWNAVRINGQWRLLDMTWGAQQFRQFSETPEILPRNYFFTDPEIFILDHLPAMPMWQLLETPVRPHEFQKPVAELQELLQLRKSKTRFDYRDSIEQWQRFSPWAKKLKASETAWQFHPVPANRNALGHLYMDWAASLSGLADPLQLEGDLHALVNIQDTLLYACEQAIRFADSLHTWQHELYVSGLINQAAALYNLGLQTGGFGSEQMQRILKLLRKAEQQILRLPKNTTYSSQASRQCQSYLTVVEKALER